MSVMVNAEKLEVIYLPSTATDKDGNPVPQLEQDWVSMDISPLKTRDIVNIQQGLSEIEIAVNMLVGRIREWSYTDDTGAAVPITFDTVTNLNINDFNHLAEKIPRPEASLADDEKKSSPSTSPQSETIDVQVL